MQRNGLRIVGFGVAAMIIMVAAQLLAHSFEASPLVSNDQSERLVDWVRRAPTAGSGVIGGSVLVVLGVALLVAVLATRQSRGSAITTRRRKGMTSVDRRTLADSLERRLASVDQRADIRVSISRRGRADLRIITPDPSATGSAALIREALDTHCAERSLPCRSGRVVTTTPKSVKGRRRVR